MKENKGYRHASHYLQEYLPGQDINCNVFCLNGRVLHSTVQESPEKPAGSYFRNDDLIFTHSEEVLALIKPVLKMLNCPGLACLDLRREKESGRLYLLEINARVWASVIASLVVAKFNFPALVSASILTLQSPFFRTTNRYTNFSASMPARFKKAPPKGPSPNPVLALSKRSFSAYLKTHT